VKGFESQITSLQFALILPVQVYMYISDIPDITPPTTNMDKPRKPSELHPPLSPANLIV